MTGWGEFDRLVANLPRRPLADRALLVEAGERLGITWPEEYVRVISEHDGAEGQVGEQLLVLASVEDLDDYNEPDFMQSFPGLVVIGTNGASEQLAIDRETGEVLWVPMLGTEEDWLVLGANLVEAFQRMERGEVYDAPSRAPRA